MREGATIEHRLYGIGVIIQVYPEHIEVRFEKSPLGNGNYVLTVSKLLCRVVR